MAEAWTGSSSAGIATPLSFEELYEVTAIARRTSTIVELWLRPLGGALAYLPGEYVLVEDAGHKVPPRSYSVANAPRPDGLISLMVTRVADGETSTWVHERLHSGDQVSISGPPRRRRPCSWRPAPAWPRSGRSWRRRSRPTHVHR